MPLPIGFNSSRATADTWSTEKVLSLRIFLLVRFRGVPSRLFLGACGVVVRTDGLLVFVYGAIALARNVENIPQLHVRPYFGPFWIQVAVDGRAKFIGRRL